MSISQIVTRHHVNRRDSAKNKQDRRRRRANFFIPYVQQLEDRRVLATFLVDSVLDTPDANLADGIAEDSSGNTTLRAAIMQANASAGEDTITLPAGNYLLTIAGRLENAAVTGDLDIVQDLIIAGAGAGVTSIDAGGLDRVFHVTPGGELDLSGVTVRGGLASDDGSTMATAQGGGLFAEVATIAISNSVISGNRAQGSNAAEGLGGGIFSFASTMSLSNSVIQNNQAVGSTSVEFAADGMGGGIFSDGTTWTLVGTTTIDRNQAIGGDATNIPNVPGGAGRGGGIFSQFSSWDNSSAGSPLQPGMVATTISRNQAIGGSGGSGVTGRAGGEGIGGGIASVAGTWTVLNTTISTNSASGGNGGLGSGGLGGAGGNGQGGGFAASIGVTASISYVTIALNQATGGVGGAGAPNGSAGTGQGGGLFQTTSSINPLSTIFATNTTSSQNPDVSGSVTTRGHNLVGNATGSTGFTAGMSDQIGTSASPINPLLGPLQNNGGPTETQALTTGSLAIDTADSTDFPATDQRGVSRPVDGDGDSVAVPDVGAFEATLILPAQIDIEKYVKKEVSPPNSGQDLCVTIGKPKEVTFRYTGGGTSATNTHQSPGKYSVVGDPRGAPTVFIRVTDSSTSSSTTNVFFSGTVLLDAAFTATAANAGLARFPANTFIHIFDPNMNLLQTVQYHTSCFSPIVLGDVTGGVTLIGVVGETGSASLPPPGPPGDFGDDADTPPGPTIALGETVRWTYVVTNPGGQSLSNVVVTDDNETPGNPFDDFKPDPVTVVVGVSRFNVGDVDRDNQLDAGEQWLYTATALVTAGGQHTNIGWATGRGSTSTVTASDPANYFTPSSGQCVDLYMNGSTSTYGSAGNIRTFTAGGTSVNASGFSRVKTTGAWASAYLGSYPGGLGVTDSSEGYGSNNSHTVDNIGRDNYVLFEFSKPVLIDKAFLGYVVDDSDITVWIGNIPNAFENHQNLSDSLLNGLGFTESNETTLTTTRWADINSGSVIGNILVIAAWTADTTPEDQFKISKLTACDPGQLSKAAIDIEKTINGVDADEPVGPQLVVGSNAAFNYTVRNFGSIPISNVVVKDDNGTPEITLDDFSPSPVLSEGFNVGDTNHDKRLDLSEVWEYTASRSVMQGTYVNIGRVTGQTSDGRTLRDSDAANYFGFFATLSVDIEKFVRGGNSQQQVGVNLCNDHGKPETLTFVYSGGGPEATNTHQQAGKYSVTGSPNNAPTVYIRVSDRLGSMGLGGRTYFFGPVNLNSEFTVVASDGGQTLFSANTYFYLFSDSAATNLLQTVGYHTSCYAPIVLGDVTGGITLTGFIGEDSELISIPPPNNTVNLGMDADKPNGPSINVGQQVVWTYRVANNGNQPLKDIVVSDDHGTPSNTSDDFRPPAILANGFNVGDVNRNNLIDTAESWYYRAIDKVITDGLYVNIGKATVKSATSNVARTDSDPAYYLGVLQAINTNQAEYPQVLVMRYTGDNVISTSQAPGKVTATGALNGATTVRIKATNSSSPNNSSARVYFDGQVSIGQNFGIDADRVGQNKLDTTTYVHIFNTSGQLLRTIRFESSRSQPLVLKDRYGGIMLVGFVGDKGATFGIQLPAATSTDLTKKVTVSGKLVLVDLTNKSADRYATIQSLLVEWPSSNKKLQSIKVDGNYIYDTYVAPTSTLITNFIGEFALRRFGPGTTIRLTFEFESNAAATGFKLSTDLGSGLTPIIP